MSGSGARYYDDFSLEGQRYVRIGERAYTRKRDGQQTTLAVWQATCRECGETFLLPSATRPVPVNPNRRCPPCVQAAREARAQETYTLPNRIASPTAPFAADYVPSEAEHATPRPAAPPVAAHVSDARAAVPPSQPPQTPSRRARQSDKAGKAGVFTDR